MAQTPKRFPWTAPTIAILLPPLAIRSIWHRDALFWQSIEDQHQSTIVTTYGLESERLGLGVFYDQQLLTQNEAIEPHFLDEIAIGRHWTSEPASTVPMPFI